MVHPRWWLEDIECVSRDWQPRLIQSTAIQSVEVAVKQSTGSDAQQIYEAIVDSLQTLQGEDLTRTKTVLTSLLTEAKDVIDARVSESQLPLRSPDSTPRFAKRIPTASERFNLAERATKMATRAAAKEVQIRARDESILTTRSQLQEEEEDIQIQEDNVIQTLSQDSIRSTITVATPLPPAPAPASIPVRSSPDSLQAIDTDDEIDAALQQAEIPHSPATVPVQDGKRKRAKSGYYVDLIAGKRRY